MGLMADVVARLRLLGKSSPIPAVDAGNSANSEVGKRPTPENSTKYLYRQMWVDPDVRQAILDVREMDRLDGRVRRIHARIARDAVKGGLVLTQTKDAPGIRREWEAFVDRLQLRNPQKLKSDARGLAMEGNLPLQWVLDDALNVVAGVRMPAETLLPNVGENGRFKSAAEAYHQIDMMTGGKIATFPMWQLFVCRLDPDSFDDMGALGRPFLDASREVWRKLRMTEEDLVIRRRHRAPLRLAHVLEGASTSDLDDYRAAVEAEKGEITTDFYMNRKGGVTAVQGDAALGEIGDVVHLLDTFFSGSPFPKGLMGYTDGMARDILEDLKRDYYEEVDSFQDTLAFGYEFGFRLHLLLKGIVLDPQEASIGFAERKTETPNQTTDRMLKWMALGLPRDLLFEEMGFNAQAIRERLDEAAKRGDPYPGAVDLPSGPKMPGGVKITPGNAPKGESMTSVGSRLGEDDGATLQLLRRLDDHIDTMRSHQNKPREPAPPVPVHVHLHDAPAAPMPVTLQAQLNMPPAPAVAPPVVQVDVHVPDAAPPVVQVDVAAPNVTVQPPAVNVDVAAPNVSLEAVVQPAEVKVDLTLPPRRTVTEIERDRGGNIARATQVETDINPKQGA
ncbi:MAG TPA: hypothetical protein PK225_02300 [Azonexus sp.]|nr:hypothetical protein [Azonexus sp.]